MLDQAPHGGLGQPFTTAKRVVPWLLLALVLMQVFGLLSTYQLNQRLWKVEQSKPKPSEAAAAAAAAKKPAAGQAKPKPASTAIPATSKVLVLSDVTLRQDPSREARALRDLKTGERLELVGKVDGWYKVKDGSDRLGWVSSSEKYTKVVDK